MLNARAYDSYFGGKSGNGTYQTIINHIPPHSTFISLFLGNCGVTRRIRPAAHNILNDIDPDVMLAWGDLGLPVSYDLLNLPAVNVLINLQDHCFAAPSDTFIYLDPPYRMASRQSQQPVYRFQMSDKEHETLLSEVTSPGRKENIMISHYPDEMYDAYLSDWSQVDFYSMTRNGLALERIYFNYHLDGTLHDYSYIGKDFREREKFERIRKNFTKKLQRLPEVLRNSILSDLVSG